jgi:6-phosphogluconolactonase
MIEHEWWDYENADEMAAALAGDIHYILAGAIAEKEAALAVFPGGSTPLKTLEKLAETDLDWASVTIVPSDDRMVAFTDPASNAGMLARIFAPLGATIIPLTEGGDGDPAAAARTANARLKAMDWAPDIAWLGMGADGHVASIFPGPDLAAALEAPHLAVAVRPDPLPANAPYARVTLTRNALLAADALTFALQGQDKRDMLEQAIADGPSSRVPVGRLLADAEQAIDLHWCP